MPGCVAWYVHDGERQAQFNHRVSVVQAQQRLGNALARWPPDPCTSSFTQDINAPDVVGVMMRD